ncbi:MAG: DUF3710 domain-containing protein [Micrococcales bacterium]
MSAKQAPANRSLIGPFDITEVDASAGYIDFGSILLPANEQLQIRLDLAEGTDRIIALSIDNADSVLQLQAFAAPKTDGVWESIRKQLVQAAQAQGGSATEQMGTFGNEVFTEIPGASGVRHARIVGIDGPRWFLRGVIGGAAVVDSATAVLIDAIFRKVVVNRGEDAVPPRDLLPLKLPAGVVLPPRTSK